MITFIISILSSYLNYRTALTSIHLKSVVMKGDVFLLADPHDQLMSLTLIIYKFDGVPQHPVLMVMRNLISHIEEPRRALKAFSEINYTMAKCYLKKEEY